MSLKMFINYAYFKIFFTKIPTAKPKIACARVQDNQAAESLPAGGCSERQVRKNSAPPPTV